MHVGHLRISFVLMAESPSSNDNWIREAQFWSFKKIQTRHLYPLHLSWNSQVKKEESLLMGFKPSAVLLFVDRKEIPLGVHIACALSPQTAPFLSIPDSSGWYHLSWV